MNGTATRRGRHKVPLRGTGNISILRLILSPAKRRVPGVRAQYPNKTLAVCFSTWYAYEKALD